MTKHSLVERVRAALARVPQVREKRMFGSTAFLVRGKMCVTARAERLMCRLDPAAHEAALARPGSQAVVMRGSPCRGYVYVAAEALPTQRALRDWVQRALDYKPTLKK